jgi:hypothetical protein
VTGMLSSYLSSFALNRYSISLNSSKLILDKNLHSISFFDVLPIFGSGRDSREPIIFLFYNLINFFTSILGSLAPPAKGY